MIVIPAIDIKDGKCVRLRQGRMEDATVFNEDPVQQAAIFSAKGARRLHIVDLNGAFAGAPVNAEIVSAIVARCPDLPVQIGGGIRSLETVQFYLDAGVSFVIIGTAAVKNPELVSQACAKFPGKIIVGLDAVEGKVATEGWADVSELEASALADRLADLGVAAIVYTDISRDGMMHGVNLDATVALAEQSSIPVIASGGVAKLGDIVDLKAASHSTAGAGIMGVIAGRSLYEGSLHLEEAQAYCDRPGD